MKAHSYSIAKIMPVMFGFFIMGFLDLVGISTSYAKDEFALNDTLANLLPMSGFFWFLVLSIPTGVLMNRIGRKNTVLASFVIQSVALLIPLFADSFELLLLTFALLGIGNTLIQVALNPLVKDLIPSDKRTSSLTAGQFIKAISSFQGPILAGWAAGTVFGWKLIFPVYAVVTILTAVWLSVTLIHEEKVDVGQSSFGASFALLKDRPILLFFIAILVLGGVDVGFNATLPKYMREMFAMEMDKAGLFNSLYFAARTIGAFLGAIILMRVKSHKVYAYSVTIAFLGGAMMLSIDKMWAISGSIVMFGLGFANLFAILFTLALRRLPEKANEVSALLIMGVSGGAFLPPVLGLVSDAFDQWSAVLVIMFIWIYLAMIIPWVYRCSKIRAVQ